MRAEGVHAPPHDVYDEMLNENPHLRRLVQCDREPGADLSSAILQRKYCAEAVPLVCALSWLLGKQLAQPHVWRDGLLMG